MMFCLPQNYFFALIVPTSQCETVETHPEEDRGDQSPHERGTGVGW